MSSGSDASSVSPRASCSSWTGRGFGSLRGRKPPTGNPRGCQGVRPPLSPLGTRGGARRSGQHHEEVVAVDVLVEIDPAGVGRNPFTRSRRCLSARVVDLAVHHDQPIPLNTCGRRRMETERRPGASRGNGGNAEREPDNKGNSSPSSSLPAREGLSLTLCPKSPQVVTGATFNMKRIHIPESLAPSDVWTYSV